MLRHNFFQFTQKDVVHIGIGFGAVFLLARWLGYNFLLPSETIIKYGFFSIMGYALAGLIGMTITGLVGKKVRQEHPEGLPINDYFREKLTPFGYRLIMPILFILSFEVIMLQVKVVDNLINIILIPSIVKYVIIFLFFVFTLISITNDVLINRITIIQLFFVFNCTITVPVYFFFVNSGKEIFEGIQLYHPYFLVLNHIDGFKFLLLAILLGFGKILLDLTSWQSFFIIEKNKIFQTFLFSGVILFSIILGFSTIFIIVFSLSGSFDTLINNLFNNINSPLLFLFIILGFFSAVFSSYIKGLNSLVNFITNHLFLEKNRTYSKLKRFAGILIILFCLLFHFAFNPSLLEIIYFFSLIHVSAIPTMLYIIFTKHKVEAFAPLCSIIGLFVGLGNIAAGYLTSIFNSFIVSCSLLVLFIVLKKFIYRDLSGEN